MIRFSIDAARKAGTPPVRGSGGYYRRRSAPRGREDELLEGGASRVGRGGLDDAPSFHCEQFLTDWSSTPSNSWDGSRCSCRGRGSTWCSTTACWGHGRRGGRQSWHARWPSPGEVETRTEDLTGQRGQGGDGHEYAGCGSAARTWPALGGPHAPDLRVRRPDLSTMRGASV